MDNTGIMSPWSQLVTQNINDSKEETGGKMKIEILITGTREDSNIRKHLALLGIVPGKSTQPLPPYPPPSLSMSDQVSDFAD